MGQKMSTSTQSHHRRSAYPTSDAPVYANFSSEKLTIGAGVAIFHIASERVVVCYHSRDKYWFLPKGRRNASEDTARAAEREGFEEVSYLLVFVILLLQTAPHVQRMRVKWGGVCNENRCGPPAASTR